MVFSHLLHIPHEFGGIPKFQKNTNFCVSLCHPLPTSPHMAAPGFNSPRSQVLVVDMSDMFGGMTHRIHGAAIYGVPWIPHQYTPVMLAYIPAPWILWVMS